jgi:hypothetical protein
MDREAYLKTAGIWAGGGLAANYAWEMLQMRLYAGFEDSAWRCFLAALGDLAILALLYALMACAAEGWLWWRRLGLPRLVLPVALGALLATVLELQALAAGKWTYGGTMPRVPFLDIGWPPLLQMTLIPLALAWLSRRWAARSGAAAGPR